MSRRTNHHLKTLFLLVVVAVGAWAAYEFLYVRGVLRFETSKVDTQETRKKVRRLILEAFDEDLCLDGVDEIAYRANEDHIRVRISIHPECIDRAREICRSIIDVAGADVDETLGVFAYDRAGNLIVKVLE